MDGARRAIARAGAFVRGQVDGETEMTTYRV